MVKYYIGHLCGISLFQVKTNRLQHQLLPQIQKNSDSVLPYLSIWWFTWYLWSNTCLFLHQGNLLCHFCLHHDISYTEKHILTLRFIWIDFKSKKRWHRICFLYKNWWYICLIAIKLHCVIQNRLNYHHLW